MPLCLLVAVLRKVQMVYFDSQNGFVLLKVRKMKDKKYDYKSIRIQ